MKGIILILSLGMLCFGVLAVSDFEQVPSQSSSNEKSIFGEYLNKRFLQNIQTGITEDPDEFGNSEIFNNSCD
nr:hypothetical protein [Sulfurospirillum sp. 'SP']